MDTAKIFKTGRSQAVRLPKKYRFATSEVEIRREGDKVDPHSDFPGKRIGGFSGAPKVP